MRNTQIVRRKLENLLLSLACIVLFLFSCSQSQRLLASETPSQLPVTVTVTKVVVIRESELEYGCDAVCPDGDEIGEVIEEYLRNEKLSKE